jgi:hypothetical protein
METRRSFMVKGVTLAGLAKIAGGSLLVGDLAFLEGCSAADWLQEASNIISLIGPLGDGILPILEIADPALVPGLTVIDAAYDAAYKAVAKFLADEAAALRAAQPTTLAQLQAFMSTLKTDAGQLVSGVGGVTVQPYAAEISQLTTAITEEINAILGIIPQIKSGVKTIKVPPVRPSKELRAALVAHFSTKTGDAKFDAVRAELASKLKKINLK